MCRHHQLFQEVESSPGVPIMHEQDLMTSQIECIVAASVMYKFGIIDIYNFRQLVVDVLVSNSELPDQFASLSLSDEHSDAGEDPLPEGTRL